MTNLSQNKPKRKFITPERSLIFTPILVGLIIIIPSITYSVANKFNRDFFNRVRAYGLISNFFFAAMINMSMVIGLLPVVGLPLPLVSYGGSSMITYFIGFGLILSMDRSLKMNY